MPWLCKLDGYASLWFLLSPARWCVRPQFQIPLHVYGGMHDFALAFCQRQNCLHVYCNRALSKAELPACLLQSRKIVRNEATVSPSLTVPVRTILEVVPERTHLEVVPDRTQLEVVPDRNHLEVIPDRNILEVVRVRTFTKALVDNLGR
jgi:hypothetical protein